MKLEENPKITASAGQASVQLGRISTVEAVTIELRRRVLDGSEAAGSALRELDLVSLFGVSRQSVRAAIQVLVHEGLLRHEPNRGVFVPMLAADDVRDIYSLRTALELEAVTVLVGHPDRLRPARKALDELAALPPDADWGEVRDADLGFHAALVDALGRPRTSRAFHSVLGELRLAFRQLRAELEDHAEVVRQHREILEAAERGDLPLAAELTRTHLDDAVEAICSGVAAGHSAETGTS
ncbi:GntR family transcriptional regulator [Saccharopolyspora spinosa]|uniref:GntR family transcriptional regulator n=1 Tax=Saccharopolyspora spinosa TaxID=60894 RepID=A0A2N3Y0B3_SACSN|nr:GntR family transcriptional regulator [Saccharopolyspora spinosa]PKW16356.1 GntR family transcriptional regulator [Saccharopolyspora spinosa]